LNDHRTAFSDILNLTGIFRLEKNRWPLHAAELQGFALELNQSLDFRGFHRFRFQGISNEEVILEFWIQTAHPDWAKGRRARVWLDPHRETSGDSLPILMAIENLPLQKVEAKSFCLI
jgi:hypothetical protein